MLIGVGVITGARMPIPGVTRIAEAVMARPGRRNLEDMLVGMLCAVQGSETFLARLSEQAHWPHRCCLCRAVRAWMENRMMTSELAAV